MAVIVTSGTAAANLYPALIEASLTGERLVLLTADRPAELIDCGANQEIRQSGMFAGFAARTLDLLRPTPAIPARWLMSPTAVCILIARLRSPCMAWTRMKRMTSHGRSAIGGRAINPGSRPRRSDSRPDQRRAGRRD